jgi:hypothetical protein
MEPNEPPLLPSLGEESDNSLMFHPWETPILFSPLIPKTSQVQGSLEGKSFGVFPLGHSQDPFHDEDPGASDDILHFKFDSDGEEEEEEMGELYNNNQLATRLHQMGYSMSLCYQAIEKYGSNMEASLRWLSNPLNSSMESSNPWSTSLMGSGPSDLLSSWYSSAAHSEDGLKEYAYTHNVKNTKITPNNSTRSSSSLGIPLSNSFHFSPSSSINNPMVDTTTDPEFYYDLSKKVHLTAQNALRAIMTQ